MEIVNISLLYLIFLLNAPAQAPPTGNIPMLDFEELESYIAERESKVLVVNFWATWCKPCVEEMPYFLKIRESYSKEELDVILVSLDFPNNYESKLLPFVAKHSINCDVVLLDDPKANVWIDKVSPEWSGAIPATRITGNGEEHFKEGMYSDYEELNTIVKALLNSN